MYPLTFKGKTCDLCVCAPDPAPTCARLYMPSSALHMYVCFYARVGVWMSVSVSLCCHICCYQGNPVGRRRSAARCTAWRRETCGAQPVVGKKPVRDSPTNPVPFPHPQDELFLSSEQQLDGLVHQRRQGKISSQRSSRCCFLQPNIGIAFSVLRFPSTKKKKTGG